MRGYRKLFFAYFAQLCAFAALMTDHLAGGEYVMASGTIITGLLAANAAVHFANKGQP